MLNDNGRPDIAWQLLRAMEQLIPKDKKKDADNLKKKLRKS